MRSTIVLIAAVCFVLVLLIGANTVTLTLLLQQQAFDHRQTQSGQAELQAVVREVEGHLDRTIRTSIADEASKFASQLGR